MNGVQELQEADFQRAVLESNMPVMVDFYATWCGPCRALAPTLEVMAKTYEGRVKIIKVNVDEAPALAQQYGIRGVPTLIFFLGGCPVDTFVGMASARVLQQKLDAIAEASVPVA